MARIPQRTEDTNKPAITRLEVHTLVHDTRATVQKAQWENNTSTTLTGQRVTLKSLQIVDVYTLNLSCNTREIAVLKQTLTSPITQSGMIQDSDPLPDLDFDWAIEVGFLPGVTDNIGTTATTLLADQVPRFKRAKLQVYSSKLYLLSGLLSENEVASLAGTLYNPLIQHAEWMSAADYKKNRGMTARIPQVHLSSSQEVTHIDLHIPDEELIKLGKQGIRNIDGSRRGPLALELDYLKAIRTYFDHQKRQPTDVELESIAQTWSEHCKHTIFANPLDELKDGLYATYIKAATAEVRARKGKKDFCVSVFKDNAGAIEFDEDYLIADKVETHNSPSALDPFGGAVTGIVGVNRDALGFGLGALPVINRYGFCLGYPEDTTPLYKDSQKTQLLLSPRRIMDGVIAGVNAGGNCSGIPTPQGFLYFHPRYKGKPLVFVGTVGLIPKKRKGKSLSAKAARPGDYIVMVGGRVGLDGIHGATFSSEALDTGSPATAVQIGDPITQKKLSDALIKEARDQHLYTSITDNGAGGLSCSVAEMARECGGCRVDLEKVPLKYPGLAPWQIWISESQERMTLAVPPRKWQKLHRIFEHHGVEATVIGEFTKAKRCVVKYKRKTVMGVEMEFLHYGLPQRQLISTPTEAIYPEPVFAQPKNLSRILQQLLSRHNITSTAFVPTQYDHEVLTGSVLKPLQGAGQVNADVTVTRPLLTSERGVALSQALFPQYSEISAYKMAECSIDAAIRSLVCVGANPEKIALLDNFCWCSSTQSERLGQLKQAVQACYDTAVVYGTPFISGKDSMFNDFKGYDTNSQPIQISIPPTLLISGISVLQDSRVAVSLDLKYPGDLIYILGETNDELGASEYYAQMGSGKTDEDQYVGSIIPSVTVAKNKLLYAALHQAIEKKLVASSISVGLGGLGVAVAKTAVAGQLGATISLQKIPGNTTRSDFALFSESMGRVLISIAPQNKTAFEKTLHAVAFAQIGTVTEEKTIVVRDSSGIEIITLPVSQATKAYRSRFGGF